MIRLGKLVREARQAKDVNQAELAELINISRPSLANIEAGKQNVAWITVCNLAVALDLDLNSIVSSDVDFERAFADRRKMRADKERRRQEIDAEIDQLMKGTQRTLMLTHITI